MGVESVLDETIHRGGDRLRVTVWLLLVCDGTSRWADRFDMPFTDVLNVEDEIAEQVARAFRGQLTGGEAHVWRGTTPTMRRPIANTELAYTSSARRERWASDCACSQPSLRSC